MSEENTQQTKAEENSVTNNDTQVEKNEAPKEVPYSRFQETNNQKKTLQTENETLRKQIEEQQQKDAQAREEQLKKNNQHEVIIKELKDELAIEKKGNDEFKSYKSSKRETLMEKLPEPRREFAEGMNLSKLEKFVESELNTINNPLKTDSSRPAQGKAGEFGGYSSVAEWAQKDGAGFTKHLEENVEGYIK